MPHPKGWANGRTFSDEHEGARAAEDLSQSEAWGLLKQGRACDFILCLRMAKAALTEPMSRSSWNSEGNGVRRFAEFHSTIESIANTDGPINFLGLRKPLMTSLHEELLEAIADGQIEKAKCLTRSGIDLNVPCDQGPLYYSPEY